MRSKLLFPILLIAFVLLGAWLGYSRYTTKQNQEASVRRFPTLKVSNLSGLAIDLKTEAANLTSVLIYYNSTCPICQSEAEMIREQFARDSLTQFLWISSEPLEEVRLFSVSLGLDTLSTHKFYSDTLFTLASMFKLTGVPATFVYDSKGDLVEYYTGAVGMTELKKTIQEAHGRSR